METKRRRIIIDGTILAVPFLAVFGWFTYLVLSSKPAEYSGQLSPSSLNSLVTFLFVFIIIYGVFLIYKFRQLKKEAK